MRHAPIRFALHRRSVLAVVGAMVALPAAGCGGKWPEVDDPRWLSTVGNPRIWRIRDLGTHQPPQSGRLQGESDGVACPGEYLLIEGTGFSRTPAVTIDGRSAEVAARTTGAGIVVRVPGSVGVGARPVEVAVGESKSSKPFPLRRLAVSLHGGTLQASAVEGDTFAAAGAPLALPGATTLALSPDGSYAYVLAGQQVLVIDLGAAGGPRQVATRDVRVPARQLLVAAHGSRLVAVAEGAAQIFDLPDPRGPSPYQPTTLPPESRGATRADLAPDGNQLALLIPEGNRIVVVDITAPPRPRLIGDVAVLPEARVALLRDVRFAPEGGTLRVISGDGPSSISVGTQPTRLSLVRLEHPEGAPEGEIQASAWLTAQVPSAWAPVRLEAVRVAPVSSGATIRLPPEKTPVRFSSVTSALLAPGAAERAPLLQGALDQGDAAGEALRIVEPRLLLGASAGAPDDSWLVATALRAEAGKREWGLASIALVKPPTIRFTPLAPAIASDLAPPFALGEVVLQP